MSRLNSRMEENNSDCVLKLTVLPPLQVSRRMGSMLYMLNLPLTGTALQAAPDKPGERSPDIGSPGHCNSEDMMASPRDPDAVKSSEHLHEAENVSPPSASSETAWSLLTKYKLNLGQSAPSGLMNRFCHGWRFVYTMNHWDEDAVFIYCDQMSLTQLYFSTYMQLFF